MPKDTKAAEFKHFNGPQIRPGIVAPYAFDLLRLMVLGAYWPGTLKHLNDLKDSTFPVAVPTAGGPTNTPACSLAGIIFRGRVNSSLPYMGSLLADGFINTKQVVVDGATVTKTVFVDPWTLSTRDDAPVYHAGFTAPLLAVSEHARSSTQALPSNFIPNNDSIFKNGGISPIKGSDTEQVKQEKKNAASKTALMSMGVLQLAFCCTGADRISTQQRMSLADDHPFVRGVVAPRDNPLHPFYIPPGDTDVGTENFFIALDYVYRHIRRAFPTQAEWNKARGASTSDAVFLTRQLRAFYTRSGVFADRSLLHQAFDAPLGAFDLEPQLAGLSDLTYADLFTDRPLDAHAARHAYCVMMAAIYQTRWPSFIDSGETATLGFIRHYCVSRKDIIGTSLQMNLPLASHSPSYCIPPFRLPRPTSANELPPTMSFSAYFLPPSGLGDQFIAYFVNSVMNDVDSPIFTYPAIGPNGTSCVRNPNTPEQLPNGDAFRALDLDTRDSHMPIIESIGTGDEGRGVLTSVANPSAPASSSSGTKPSTKKKGAADKKSRVAKDPADKKPRGANGGGSKRPAGEPAMVTPPHKLTMAEVAARASVDDDVVFEGVGGFDPMSLVYATVPSPEASPTDSAPTGTVPSSLSSGAAAPPSRADEPSSSAAAAPPPPTPSGPVLAGSLTKGRARQFPTSPTPASTSYSAVQLQAYHALFRLIDHGHPLQVSPMWTEEQRNRMADFYDIDRDVISALELYDSSTTTVPSSLHNFLVTMFGRARVDEDGAALTDDNVPALITHLEQKIMSTLMFPGGDAYKALLETKSAIVTGGRRRQGSIRFAHTTLDNSPIGGQEHQLIDDQEDSLVAALQSLVHDDTDKGKAAADDALVIAVLLIESIARNMILYTIRTTADILDDSVQNVAQKRQTLESRITHALELSHANKKQKAPLEHTATATPTGPPLMQDLDAAKAAAESAQQLLDKLNTPEKSPASAMDASGAPPVDDMDTTGGMQIVDLQTTERLSPSPPTSAPKPLPQTSSSSSSSRASSSSSSALASLSSSSALPSSSSSSSALASSSSSAPVSSSSSSALASSSSARASSSAAQPASVSFSFTPSVSSSSAAPVSASGSPVAQILSTPINVSDDSSPAHSFLAAMRARNARLTSYIGATTTSGGTVSTRPTLGRLQTQHP